MRLATRRGVESAERIAPTLADHIGARGLAGRALVEAIRAYVRALETRLIEILAARS